MRGAAAHRAQRQAVDFLVGLKTTARMANRDVTQDARGVVVIVAAEAMDDWPLI